MYTTIEIPSKVKTISGYWGNFGKCTIEISTGKRHNTLQYFLMKSPEDEAFPIRRLFQMVPSDINNWMYV